MSDKDSEILVILLGGTIAGESYKDKTKPKIVNPTRNDLVETVIRGLPGSNNYIFSDFRLAKDSNHLTREDKLQLISVMKAAKQRKFFIVLGSDCLADFGRDINDALKELDAVGVLAAAIHPLTHGWISDGPANIRNGFAFLEKVDPRHPPSPGAYASMNKGKDVFIVDDQLQKDMETGIFSGNKAVFKGPLAWQK